MKPSILAIKLGGHDKDDSMGEEDEGGEDLAVESIMNAFELFSKGKKEEAAEELKGAIEACVSEYSKE